MASTSHLQVDSFWSKTEIRVIERREATVALLSLSSRSLSWPVLLGVASATFDLLGHFTGGDGGELRLEPSSSGFCTVRSGGSGLPGGQWPGLLGSTGLDIHHMVGWAACWISRQGRNPDSCPNSPRRSEGRRRHLHRRYVAWRSRGVLTRWDLQYLRT